MDLTLLSGVVRNRKVSVLQVVSSCYDLTSPGRWPTHQVEHKRFFLPNQQSRKWNSLLDNDIWPK
jgi:hypothetical protein